MLGVGCHTAVLILQSPFLQFMEFREFTQHLDVAHEQSYIRNN